MNPTVGQQLRAARERMGISLEDAARETHIRLNYLQELENDHPELLRSATQARGFLRLYADLLHLPFGELLRQWEDSSAGKAPESFDESPQASEEEPKRGWLARNLSRKKDTEDSVEEKEKAHPHKQGAQSDAGDSQTDEPQTPSSATIPPAESDVGIEGGGAGLFKESTNTGTTLLSRLADGLARLSLTRFFRRGKYALSERDEESTLAGEVPVQQNSEELFREIGSSLHERRQQMQLKLSDIENFTNLKRSVLVALEDGRFSELPSSVQGRGMLNNYAQFLGMQDEAVLEMYGRALQLQREEHMQPRKQPRPSVTVNVNLPEKWRRIVNPDLLIGSALILGLFTFIIWGATQVFGSAGTKPTEAPSISEMLQITPSQSPVVQTSSDAPAGNGAGNGEALEEQPTRIPGVEVAESTPTVVATVNPAPLQVYIIANDRAFLRVTVDGVKAFDGRVSPGSAYTYSGEESITLLSGNAAALEVYFNQEFIGTLGRVGEVVNINFTLDGLITPTPALTTVPAVTIVPENLGETMDDAMLAE